MRELNTMYLKDVLSSNKQRHEMLFSTYCLTFLILHMRWHELCEDIQVIGGHMEEDISSICNWKIYINPIVSD